MIFNPLFLYPQLAPTYPPTFPQLFFCFSTEVLPKPSKHYKTLSSFFTLFKTILYLSTSKKIKFNHKLQFIFNYPTYQPTLITKTTNSYLYNL